MNQLTTPAACDYKPGAPPSTYDHRGGECAEHGENTVVYRRKHSRDPYRCVECQLDVLRAILAALYASAAEDAIADLKPAPVLRLVTMPAEESPTPIAAAAADMSAHIEHLVEVVAERDATIVALRDARAALHGAIDNAKVRMPPLGDVRPAAVTMGIAFWDAIIEQREKAR